MGLVASSEKLFEALVEKDWRKPESNIQCLPSHLQTKRTSRRQDYGYVSTLRDRQRIAISTLGLWQETGGLLLPVLNDEVQLWSATVSRHSNVV